LRWSMNVRIGGPHGVCRCMIWSAGRTLNSKDESVARKFRVVQRERNKKEVGAYSGVDSAADRCSATGCTGRFAEQPAGCRLAARQLKCRV
jgi:hypothetical protein